MTNWDPGEPLPDSEGGELIAVLYYLAVAVGVVGALTFPIWGPLAHRLVQG